MEPTRRRFLASAGADAVAGLAGCTGRPTLEGAAFAAAGATLPRDVQRETGYTHHRTDETTATRQFERFGVGRTVEVTSVVAEYDRAIELGLLGRRVQAAVFAVLSTPPVRIFGRACNPVARMTPTELAETDQQRYAKFDDLTPVESFEGRAAGAADAVRRRCPTAGRGPRGGRTPLRERGVECGGEYVVALAVHPRALGRRAATVE
jgi:hypothetical protein